MKKTGIALTALVAVSLLMAGCGRKSAATAENTSEKEEGGVIAAAIDAVETVLEEMESEPETQMEYRPVKEVLDGKTVEWMDAFDAGKVRDLKYTSRGEELEEFVITDKELIDDFFDAISHILVAGASDIAAEDAGDDICFEMEDGSSHIFSFVMSNLVVDGVPYETDEADALWELTGSIE